MKAYYADLVEFPKNLDGSGATHQNDTEYGSLDEAVAGGEQWGGTIKAVGVHVLAYGWRIESGTELIYEYETRGVKVRKSVRRFASTDDAEKAIEVMKEKRLKVGPPDVPHIIGNMLKFLDDKQLWGV